MEKIRCEILEFAKEMEKIMKKHDKKKGDTWKTVSINFLKGKLIEEFDEYIVYENTDELVDIANICMMLWHRLKMG